MSAAPFIVFYRHHGEDYSRGFPTMRAAKQFARVTGGKVETRLAAYMDWAKNTGHLHFIKIGN
jgi:hypothetical protein